MKDKRPYTEPRTCWADYPEADLLCYSTDIDSYEYEEVDWTEKA